MGGSGRAQITKRSTHVLAYAAMCGGSHSCWYPTALIDGLIVQNWPCFSANDSLAGSNFIWRGGHPTPPQTPPPPPKGTPPLLSGVGWEGPPPCHMKLAPPPSFHYITLGWHSFGQASIGHGQVGLEVAE